METLQPEKVAISPQLKTGIEIEEEKQTIIHCRYKSFSPTHLRIWLSTYLITNVGRKCKLLEAFDISLMPDWYYCISKGGYCNFTLIFEGLSKQASSFYLDEIIPEPGGFYTHQINRNKTDVYEVEVFTKI